MAKSLSRRQVVNPSRQTVYANSFYHFSKSSEVQKKGKFTTCANSLLMSIQRFMANVPFKSNLQSPFL